jgi:hypothetical protein
MFGFIALHCMIDDLSWQLQYNSFWLAIGMLLMRVKEKKHRTINQSQGGSDALFTEAVFKK